MKNQIAKAPTYTLFIIQSLPNCANMGEGFTWAL